MNNPRREARRWLKAAREDLEYARHAAKGGFDAPACFHAQQAAEKAVKALHYRRGARAVIGHNVRALIEQLHPRQPRLDEHLDAARELDLFYLPTRYPNGLDTGTPSEAFSPAQSAHAVELALPIIDAAAAIIEAEE